MKTKFIITIFALITFITACKKKPALESPPTIADAEFSVTPSAETNNIIIFTAFKKDAVSQWDFGNSTNGEGVSSKGD